MTICQPHFQNYILLEVGSWVCHEKDLRFTILMTMIVEVGIGEGVKYRVQ